VVSVRTVTESIFMDAGGAGARFPRPAASGPDAPSAVPDRQTDGRTRGARGDADSDADSVPDYVGHADLDALLRSPAAPELVACASASGLTEAAWSTRSEV
jgi:hypothetical protein